MGKIMSGQAGNTFPAVADSTDTMLLDYQVGIKRPVVAIDATTYKVKSSQTGTFFTYGGQAAGLAITIPAPEPGLWFEFAATGAIATAVSTFVCATTDAFIHAGPAGTSGGVGKLNASATTSEFSVAEGGLYLEFVGLSTSRYLVKQWSAGSSVASTAAFVGATGG